jgi:hypothetical protein
VDKEGDRIRFLIANRPEWVEGGLVDMGVDPFSAQRYGRLSAGSGDRAALAEEVLRYMDATAQSRNDRLTERGRKRAKQTPAPRLPIDINAPSGYEVIRGQGG